MASEIKKQAPRRETRAIERYILIWLNAYPDFPDGIPMIEKEPMLQEKKDGLELTVISNTITSTDIVGGHTCEFQFGIIYRLFKPSGPDERLKAQEFLSELGDYAINTQPSFPSGVVFQGCNVTSDAIFMFPYESGDEDYEIQLQLTYYVPNEVIFNA